MVALRPTLTRTLLPLPYPYPLPLPLTRSLSFAHARQIALDRAGHSPALASGASVRTLDLEKWSLLHAPLPLGFLGGVDSGQPALSAAEREAKQASEADPSPNPNSNPNPNPNPNPKLALA